MNGKILGGALATMEATATALAQYREATSCRTSTT